MSDVVLAEVGKNIDAGGIRTNVLAVWGYQPSVENIRRIMDYFAYSRELVSDELAEVRYLASILPGSQEAFSAMFPAPRRPRLSGPWISTSYSSGSSGDQTGRGRP